MVAAAADSEAKPCTGARRIILTPRVLMMRQPPAEVPKAMAEAHRNTTHMGT